ncbi:hypothetical protein E2320_000522 [Naja naja]|nr:hypothetical protein E2320_000522 [Naja naja]
MGTKIYTGIRERFQQPGFLHPYLTEKFLDRCVFPTAKSEQNMAVFHKLKYLLQNWNSMFGSFLFPDEILNEKTFFFTCAF